ncbi:permease prefix domain 1-containing protein [Naasia aerilata]|uniref:DUF4153 domain-containing protein n=1 Tax=Naasia aerilata TaxID=1162966 RepID=A0ABN6XHK1_9MICO|nr:permease prefix domain 1-containing protein [Naasia aerilata]BDZ44344.1 hypothetical protein GCM10025866_02530 [Naasia aerilata]
MATLDTDIADWRAAVSRGRAVAPADADELEHHLRDQIAELVDAGLTEDEAFLVAVKRLGKVDVLTAEFAREHSERLWKQLVLDHAEETGGWRRSPLLAAGFAAVAAVLIQVARVAAGVPETDAPWFLRDVSLFVLPVLAAYFVASRGIRARWAVGLGVVIALLAVAVGVFPFPDGSATGVLVAVHLPVVLWFVAGAAYVAGDWRSSARRMDFIRFTGEWAIYYVLIALGGGVLVGLTGLVLAPIAPASVEDVALWVVPSGAAGAVLVAAWLVEAKKSVIENIAPVLTAIFTPLFAVMLLVAVGVYAAGGIGRDFDRDLLTVFDALLLVVLGLVLYGLSAREPAQRAGVLDGVRFAAIAAALVLDVLVLGSMLSRIGEFGFTANRMAALGLNLLLVANLGVTAWRSVRMLFGSETADRLERWQTGYLPVFGVWAAIVVLVLPPVFLFA